MLHLRMAMPGRRDRLGLRPGLIAGRDDIMPWHLARTLAGEGSHHCHRSSRRGAKNHWRADGRVGNGRLCGLSFRRVFGAICDTEALTAISEGVTDS